MPYLHETGLAWNHLVIHVKGVHFIRAFFTLGVISNFRLLDHLYIIIKQTYGIVRDDCDNRDDLYDTSASCYGCPLPWPSKAML